MGCRISKQKKENIVSATPDNRHLNMGNCFDKPKRENVNDAAPPAPLPATPPPPLPAPTTPPLIPAPPTPSAPLPATPTPAPLPATTPPPLPASTTPPPLPAPLPTPPTPPPLPAPSSIPAPASTLLTNVRDMNDALITCSIDAEWKFYKSDLMDLKKTGKNGKCYYAYNILGLQYYVMINPNGDLEERHGETAVAFHLTGLDDRMIMSELTFFIESANFSHKFNHVYEDGSGFGTWFDKSIEFLNSESKYFVDGILIIKVKGILKAPRPLISKTAYPISYQWKIKEEELKAKKDSKGILRSKEIETFSGTKYHLEICPSKTKDSDEDLSSVYLYLKTESKTEKKIKTVYDFFINSGHISRCMEYNCEGSNCCGVWLCLTNNLFDPTKRFFVNGYLTINVNGIMMIGKNNFITFNSKNDLAPKVQQKNEKDFLIAAREQHIHVNKQVLIDVSPVLAEMFELGTIKDSITIKGFSSKTVDAAIKLCYSCDESFEYTLEDLLSLYRFGDKYRIQLVMDIVEDYLIKEVSSSNVVYLTKFSSPDSFNAIKLHQSCLDFIIKCLKESTPIYALESLDKDVIIKLLHHV